MGQDEKCIPNFGRKPSKGKDGLGRPRRTWKDNIKIVLRWKLWEDVDWIISDSR
jgi:hypothetical protein